MNKAHKYVTSGSRRGGIPAPPPPPNCRGLMIYYAQNAQFPAPLFLKSARLNGSIKNIKYIDFG